MFLYFNSSQWPKNHFKYERRSSLAYGLFERNNSGDR